MFFLIFNVPTILVYLFLRCSERLRHKKDFFSRFLVEPEEDHKDILKKMGLEHFCLEPFFSNLRSNMTELVGLLATVAAGLPRHDYGFYRLALLLVFKGTVRREIHGEFVFKDLNNGWSVSSSLSYCSFDPGRRIRARRRHVTRSRRLLTLRVCLKKWLTTA